LDQEIKVVVGCGVAAQRSPVAGENRGAVSCGAPELMRREGRVEAGVSQDTDSACGVEAPEIREAAVVAKGTADSCGVAGFVE
jgi:hypothetical protein